VRINLHHQCTSAIASCLSPSLIAVGMVALLANALWHSLPVAVPFSLVALGATTATIYRLRHSGALSCTVVIHLTVYLSLYVLLIGAICNAASRSHAAGLTISQLIDLGLSTAIMAHVAKNCVASLVRATDASVR